MGIRMAGRKAIRGGNKGQAGDVKEKERNYTGAQEGSSAEAEQSSRPEQQSSSERQRGYDRGTGWAGAYWVTGCHMCS